MDESEEERFEDANDSASLLVELPVCELGKLDQISEVCSVVQCVVVRSVMVCEMDQISDVYISFIVYYISDRVDRRKPRTPKHKPHWWDTKVVTHEV